MKFLAESAAYAQILASHWMQESFAKDVKLEKDCIVQQNRI